MGWGGMEGYYRILSSQLAGHYSLTVTLRMRDTAGEGAGSGASRIGGQRRKINNFSGDPRKTQTAAPPPERPTEGAAAPVTLPPHLPSRVPFIT